MSTRFSPLGAQGTLDGGAEPIVAGGPLARRWLAPPFSVLDARSGDWQERKAAWLSLGIQSEIGRAENLLGFSDTVNAGGYDAEGKSKAAEQQGGGTSIFDPVLCELAYSWWSPVGGKILDPFAGGSVRGIVAGMLGRRYYGVDLSARQIDANKEQAERIAPLVKPRWRCGDSAEQLSALCGEIAPFDMALTCPPYGDLERYSSDPRDLSNMTWGAFEDGHWRAIRATLELLAPDAFAVWVVGDFRDKASGAYRGFVGSTIDAFRAFGAALYNEAVLITPAGSMSLRAERIFAPGRKLVKGHQNVLVFVKGDWRKAAARCRSGEEEQDGEE